MRAYPNDALTEKAGGMPLSPAAAWARADRLLPKILTRMRRQAGADGVLGRAAQYHLGRKGRSFRARLLAACAAQLGVADVSAIPAAAACELLHNASLIHDDLQDGDELRRGAPTVWRRFGPDVAVYLGDHFITQAFVLIAQAADPARASQLVEVLASTVATAIGGQLTESRFDFRLLQTPEAYRRMAVGKSGSLFALPVHVACLLANTDAEITAAARKILELYGVAYQIKDDLLDILGGKEGRPAGSDLTAGKANAVLVSHLVASNSELTERFVAELNSGMSPRRRQWWLTELNQPAVLAHATREHAHLLAEADMLSPALPRALWETLRFGLAPMVALPSPRASQLHPFEEGT